MNYKHLLSLSILSILISLSGFAQISTPLFIVKPYPTTGNAADSIWMIPDTTNYSQESPGVQLTISGSTETLLGCTGLAIRPCTGEFFVVYYTSATGGISRYLGIVDPATGIINQIGNMGDNVSGITFGAEDQLYAVTGDGASTPETLYKVDITTGAMTLFIAYGNGDDGEQIAFCPDNGSIYHWSGIFPDNIMEKTDTASGGTVNVPLSGFIYSEIRSSVYLGNGQFLTQNSDQSLMVIDTAGVAQTPAIGDTLDDVNRGMAFPVAWIKANGPTSVCTNDSTTLESIAGDSYQWLLNGMPIAGETGPALTTTMAGNYQCEIMAGGCTVQSNTITINTLNIPSVGINPGPNAYFCAEGDSVMLTGSMGGQSQWYLNGVAIAGADSNTIYASVPGSYNMTKTNTNGCTDSANVATIVSLAPANMIAQGDTATRCFGDSVLLSTTAGADKYEWYFEGTLVDGANDDSLFASENGVYTSVAVFGECRDSTMTGTTVLLEDSCSTNIDPLLFADDLKIYPIPVTMDLNLSWTSHSSAAIELEIYSLEGKLIHKNQYTNFTSQVALKIDTHNYPQGVYLIRVNQGDRSLTAKFVKE